jgi:hypothetical protein
MRKIVLIKDIRNKMLANKNEYSLIRFLVRKLNSFGCKNERQSLSFVGFLRAHALIELPHHRDEQVVTIAVIVQ